MLFDKGADPRPASSITSVLHESATRYNRRGDAFFKQSLAVKQMFIVWSLHTAAAETEQQWGFLCINLFYQ